MGMKVFGIAKIKPQYLLSLVFMLLVLVQFNNCSKYKQPKNESSISAGTSLEELGGVVEMRKTGDLCEDEIRQHFAEEYYPFLAANCIQCHAIDSDKPQFASPDANWAYEVFQTRGFLKVSSNAISTTHNPPATGPHLSTEVNKLKSDWRLAVTEYNACKNIPDTALVTNPNDIVKIETTPKFIRNAAGRLLSINEEVTLTWSLRNEVGYIDKTRANDLNYANGEMFSIKVRRRQTAAGTDYYTIREPMIYSNTEDYTAKTIYIRINSRILTYPTTFKYVNKGVYAGATLNGKEGLLSAGGTSIYGNISKDDTLAVTFEGLARADIGQPPVPVTVAFEDTSVRVIRSNNPANRDVAFKIIARGAITAPVVLEVAQVGDVVSACNATSNEIPFLLTNACMPRVFSALQANGYAPATQPEHFQFFPARSLDGGTAARFDWDYKFVTSTITLTPDATSATVVVKFSDDLRYEENRLFRLRINPISDNVRFDTAKPEEREISAVVLKMNNPERVGSEVLYSDLMRSGGLFAQHCTECHNSVEFRGSYDITNYGHMYKTDGVLDPRHLPNNWRNTKLYIRLLAPAANSGIEPMPRTGPLHPVDQLPYIENWLSHGAKNN